ncbi:caspase family protein [Dactylosporangium sp. NPDC005572]|uniref:caspase, EACC1-associated type n=1 Tax=Dactylosporangium sp. NPDC005572 TaxID=3156889 RepID=UPI0033B407DD
MLIGTSRYAHDDLPDQPVVRNNLTDLAAVLTDPEFGVLPAEHCMVVHDETNLTFIGRQLRSAASAATDLLLVYYAGHGCLHPRLHTLHLALPETDPDDLGFSAVAIDVLKDSIARSPARSKVLIIDSCFSGRAFTGHLASTADRVRAQIAVRGTYTFASAAGNTAAVVMPGERHTAFTGRLLRLLRHGVPDGPAELDLELLYGRIDQLMLAESLPRPERFVVGDIGRLVLAGNRAYVPEPPPGSDAERPDVGLRWAVFTRAPGTMSDYGVVASGADLPGDLAATIRDHLGGVPDPGAFGQAGALPWISFSGCTAVDGEPLLAVAVTTASDARDGLGRVITATRFYALPWQTAADTGLTWTGLYRTIRDIRFADVDAAPAELDAHDRVAVPLHRMAPPVLSESDLSRWATVAAAIVDGRSVVIVVDALDPPSVDERLRLLDAIGALMPYGSRARLRAGTWADHRAQHRLQLHFGLRAGPGQIAVAWHDDEFEIPVGPRGRMHLDRLRAMRAAGATAADLVAELAGQREFRDVALPVAQPAPPPQDEAHDEAHDEAPPVAPSLSLAADPGPSAPSHRRTAVTPGETAALVADVTLASIRNGFAAALLAAVGLLVFSFGIGSASGTAVLTGLGLLAGAVLMTVVVNAVKRARARRRFVAGTAFVMDVTPQPTVDAVFARCQLQLVVNAPGVAAVAVRVRDPRVPVDRWPEVGAQLPVLVRQGDPRRVLVMWDRVQTHDEAAAS